MGEDDLHALLCLLMYFLSPFSRGSRTVRDVVQNLPAPSDLRERRRWQILDYAVKAYPSFGDAVIGEGVYSKEGMTACLFHLPDGCLAVVFKGTGSGEWIDNGEALSGVPEENTYYQYDAAGEVIGEITVAADYAADQQVEALNWFRKLAAKNHWDAQNDITVSGHSKGGNKAQFITIHEELVDRCYSFNGQGFSPEALAAWKKQYGDAFDERRRKAQSLCTDNDYVGVLGMPLMPPENIRYHTAAGGFHFLESMLQDDGRFRPRSTQGGLSRYVASVSERLMRMPPHLRHYATRGVMNLFQKYMGEGTPVNDDTVSREDTAAGLMLAVATFLRLL